MFHVALSFSVPTVTSSEGPSSLLLLFMFTLALNGVHTMEVAEPDAELACASASPWYWSFSVDLKML